MSRMLITASIAALSFTVSAQAQRLHTEFNSDARPAIGAITVTVDAEIIGERYNRIGTSRPIPVHPREAEDFVEELEEDLVRELTEAGVYQPQLGAPVGTLNVVVTRATPSNPGFTRNGRDANISANGSFGRGGATLAAEWLAPDGTVVASFGYSYTDTFLDPRFAPRGGWTETYRTFDRFARRVADEIEESQPASAFAPS